LARFDGRKLLNFEEARSFTGSGITLTELVESLDLAIETKAGKPVQWDI